jgi:hypothetical protein
MISHTRSHIAPRSLEARSLEAQLDLLLISRWISAAWAEPIWAATDLPIRLQHCIRKLARGTVWRAYTDAAQVYFAIGRVPARKPGSATPAMLEAYFLDAEATLLGGGLWSYDSHRGFQLEPDSAGREPPAEAYARDRRPAPTLLELAFGRGNVVAG